MRDCLIILYIPHQGATLKYRSCELEGMEYGDFDKINLNLNYHLPGNLKGSSPRPLSLSFPDPSLYGANKGSKAPSSLLQMPII